MPLTVLVSVLLFCENFSSLVYFIFQMSDFAHRCVLKSCPFQTMTAADEGVVNAHDILSNYVFDLYECAYRHYWLLPFFTTFTDLDLAWGSQVQCKAKALYFDISLDKYSCIGN